MTEFLPLFEDFNKTAERERLKSLLDIEKNTGKEILANIVDNLLILWDAAEEKKAVNSIYSQLGKIKPKTTVDKVYKIMGRSKPLFEVGWLDEISLGDIQKIVDQFMTRGYGIALVTEIELSDSAIVNKFIFGL